MDKPTKTVRQIFDEASELLDAATRAQFVAQACAGDDTLRRRVEGLLRAHDTAGGFMWGVGESSSPKATAGSTEIIGRYRVLEKIGEGGCGVVYRAEQQEPVKRKVALKVIKLGMDTRSVIARFEAERQALAMMEHPNIAKVLDSGATDSGRPYFVMELVEGIRITEFCDRNNLSTTERLELFIRVCHAVQHAHQKGVIHRDLKPSNILVSQHDGVPVPKVIDFGIAKATTDLQLTDKTIFTHAELFLGTPAYMSPEQARMGGVDIDTRSDIYSIGVLLYELLTGRPPFDGEELLRAGIDSLRRTICETDPAKPSTRLRQLPVGEQSIVAGFRATEPPRLISSVRGDLDWIVLKALEKDRARRYESAGALAVDLRRHLDNEPVGARPPSGWDAFQKLVRRNRTFFFSAFAAALALVVGLGIATVMFFREREARQRAVYAEHTQSELRRDADEAREIAQAKTEESRRQLVLLNVSSGNKLIANGDHAAALLWFVEAMRLEQGDAAREDIHRRRIAATRRFIPRLAHIGFMGRFVAQAAFTADSQRVVAMRDDGRGSVWDFESGITLESLVPHSSELFQRTVSSESAVPGIRDIPALPGGIPHDLSLVESPEGLVVHDRYWNTNGTRLSGSKGPYLETRVSGDGKRALALQRDYTLYRWELSSGEPLGSPMTFPGTIHRLWMSRDGSVFGATFGSQPCGLGVWEFATGRQLMSLHSPLGDIFDCQLSPDGKWIGAASWEGLARIYDVATGLPTGDAMRHARGVGRSIFSPDGKKFATASWDGTARIWNPQNGSPASPGLHHAGYVAVAAFSPDSKWLLTGGQDESVRVWDLEAASVARHIFRHDGRVTFAAYSQDGNRIATAGRNGWVNIWDRSTGALLASNQIAVATSVGRFSPSGRQIAIGSTNGAVTVLDGLTATIVHSFRAHTNVIASLEFSADGTRLLTASTDGSAGIWDSSCGKLLAPLMRHRGPVRTAEFSRDGKRLVTASRDHSAQVWDAATGKRVGQPMKHVCDVYWASFSPDGKRVVTAPSDISQLSREARVWNAETGESVGPPLAHRDGVLFAAYSPDGRFIVTGSEDTTAVVWDAVTGLATTPPLRHASYIWHASFSPDSRLLLTVSMDKTARVWDAASGEAITPPLIHNHQVSAGEWSPDGREVITYSPDGTARVWDVSPTTEPLHELQREAELLSAHKLRLGLGMAPLSVAELQERWQAFRPRP